MRLALLMFMVCANAFGQWQLQESHTKESLRGVSVVDANVVWASGTHGTYILTTDGGKTWSPHQVQRAETLDFRGVKAFVSEAFLLAAGPGEQSRIYHTSNFGKNWKLQFTNPEPKGFFDCMVFSDSKHGFVVGDPVNGKFRILRTEDGGKNWRLASGAKMPAALDGEGAFAASNSCLAVRGNSVWFATGGTAARVFRSTDGGETWSVAETPIIHGAASQGIFSIAFEDGLHGVIAGGDYAQPEQGGANLAVTDDGGKAWQSVSVQPQKFFSAVAYLTNSSGSVSTLAMGLSVSAFSRDHLRGWKFFAPAGLQCDRFFGPHCLCGGPKRRYSEACPPLIGKLLGSSPRLQPRVEAGKL